MNIVKSVTRAFDRRQLEKLVPMLAGYMAAQWGGQFLEDFLKRVPALANVMTKVPDGVPRVVSKATALVALEILKQYRVLDRALAQDLQTGVVFNIGQDAALQILRAIKAPETIQRYVAPVSGVGYVGDRLSDLKNQFAATLGMNGIASEGKVYNGGDPSLVPSSGRININQSMFN